jgi:hypothetical protein
MPRYKGRASAKEIEKDFPHIVEMRVPLGGFGSKLNAMHRWHKTRCIGFWPSCSSEFLERHGGSRASYFGHDISGGNFHEAIKPHAYCGMHRNAAHVARRCCAGKPGQRYERDARMP